jgi:iron complex outermembrane recepter protein
VSAISLGLGAGALWASTGWAQQPPADAPPADEPPSPPASAPSAEPAPPADSADVPPPPALNEPPAADESSADPESMDVDMGPSATNAGSGELDEVVVTVDRRKKNLQAYSGTAAAFSETQLTNLGINTVSQLTQVVPGLQIGVNDQGSATVYIRGVGSDNTTELGDPAVAVHLDGVYLPRVRGLNAAYLDVERVEVNSGPQGTLRGRNATGGSVNIISRPAVYGEYQANAEMTFGTFRQRMYQGMLNVPFGDHVALRVAGASNTIDATWKNGGPLDYLPGAQNTDDYALKGQLRFNPASGLDITIAGDYTLQRSAGYVGLNLQNVFTNRNNNGTPDNLNDDFAAPLSQDDIDNPRTVYQRGRYPETELEHWGVRLNATYDVGPVVFELLGSYRWQDWHLWSGSNAGAFADVDSTNSASRENLVNQNWDSWSFASQQQNNSGSYVGEFRIASPDTGRVVWSVGLFGFYEDQGAFLGQITGDPDGGFNEFNMPSTVGNSVAAYGDVNFKLTDAFRLLAGIRVTKEHKDRLGGLWMIGSNLPQEGLTLCAARNAQGECVQQGLGQGASSAGSNDIGRFGTEGFNYKGLDRENYNVPGATASKEDRVNFFLDGVKSFGARDQTAIALCNDPPAEQQTNAAGMPGNIVTEDSRLLRNEDGNFRCRYGVRPGVPNNFTDARPQNGRRNDTYLDFRAGFEYDVLKDNMVYGTLSSGHKAGGFNDSIPIPGGVDDDYTTPGYGPETAYALEIGSKNLFAGRKLRVNASAFAYLYKDLQFQTILTVGDAPPIDPTTNMPAIDPTTNLPYIDNRGGSAARQNAKDTAHIYGLDVDTVLSLPAGLEADLHALFMNAKFPDGTYVNDDRLGLGSAPAQVDIGGNWLPRVSPFTFNYSLSQIIFTEAGSFDWIIQAQTRGKHFFNAFNGDGTGFEDRAPGWGIDPVTGQPNPIESDTAVCTAAGQNTCNNYAAIAANPQRLDDHQPTYTTVNVGLGWKKPDGMIGVRFFVNNVFDTLYATNIISQSGFNGHYFNDPRMAGVRVRMDF